MKLHVATPRLPVANRRFYLLLAGNLVVLALIGFFVLRPLFGMLDGYTTEITRTKSEIAALERKTAELSRLKETFPAYEATYGPMVRNAPKTKDVAGYQTELEDLAALTGVKLETVDTSGTPDQPAQSGQSQAAAAPKPVSIAGFPAFPVRLNLSGSYAGILDYVSRLETMDRFTRVTALQLQRANDAGAISATLSVQSLYFGT